MLNNHFDWKPFKWICCSDLGDIFSNYVGHVFFQIAILIEVLQGGKLPKSPTHVINTSYRLFKVFQVLSMYDNHNYC